MIPFIVISYACFALCIVVVLLGRKGTEEDKNLRRMKTLIIKMLKHRFMKET